MPLGHDESWCRDNWEFYHDIFCKEILLNYSITKIAQNAKFEYIWALKYGYSVKGRFFDTMLMKHLLDERKPHSLASQVARFIPHYKDYKDDTEKLAKIHGWGGIPLQTMADRNSLDCDLTFRLAMFYEDRLIKSNLYNLFRNLTCKLVPTLAECEFDGILIDIDSLVSTREIVKEQWERHRFDLVNHKSLKRFDRYRRKDLIKSAVKALMDEISELEESDKPNARKLIDSRLLKIQNLSTGVFTTKKDQEFNEPFNPNSSQQLAEFLFTHKRGLKLKYNQDIVSKKTGIPSTGEAVLIDVRVQDNTGFIKTMFLFREVDKIYGTYLIGLEEKLSPKHTIHGKIHIHGTETGRFSSAEPNLQNMPRATTSSYVKSLFLPPKGCLLFEVDYSQAELRAVAEMSDETTMIEWFDKGWNIHVATACKSHKMIDKYDEVKKILKDETHPEWLKWEKRKKKAKTINFGILYGQTSKALSKATDEEGNLIFSSMDEAQEFIDIWLKDFPKISKFMKDQHKFAKKHGMVIQAFGRKRRLPEINSKDKWEVLAAQRRSVNSPIQGIASDFTAMSITLIRDYRLMGKLPDYFRLMYTVHDSLGYPIKPKDIHTIEPIVSKICMEPETDKWFGFKFKKVKMKVSAEVGKNWAPYMSTTPTLNTL